MQYFKESMTKDPRICTWAIEIKLCKETNAFKCQMLQDTGCVIKRDEGALKHTMVLV